MTNSAAWLLGCLLTLGAALLLAHRSHTVRRGRRPHVPIEPGTVAPRLAFPGRDLFLLATLILILIALIGVFGQNHVIQAEQHASEQRGYKNRAVICDMIAGLGLHEGRECADPNIQHYRDSTAATTGTTGARNSRTTLTAVCHLAQHLQVTVPECDPAG